MCLQKFPPSLQIFQNLPLDRYLHVLTEIPPPGCRFLKSHNLPLDSYLRFSKICYWTICACRNYPTPQFVDFPKSATGQIPTCAYRNPSPLGFADFPKSATGQLPKLPTCACRNSPASLQIFQNLPLDSYLSYLHVLAEIPSPQFADFPKSATGQL